MKENYQKVVEAMRAAKVPCRVSLWPDEISIECGFNYPEELCNKIDDALESVGVSNNDVCVCADMGRTGLIERTTVFGGPKQYWNTPKWG